MADWKIVAVSVAFEAGILCKAAVAGFSELIVLDDLVALARAKLAAPRLAMFEGFKL